MLKHTTLEFGDSFKLGPRLSEHEWQQLLQRHRGLAIEQLRSIFRKDLVVTKEKRTEIERAAHGMWSY
ncbi:hypothetical protein [Bradyrhizobium sp. AUGA SZCCT0283]|uniref:hypothetical protein n=1 Tax=Bradyrhizobium sp. AUGA SZCCT0283 TaxID=2807671 RepID=UPI001BA77C90|nr:hypothetical protein [Bradyrhizobium sp. AUGA SZCCT0283]MBR1276107.1 hypothetical protein [Bradyrhizobium sp. AUGA SZCCT0283]